MANVLDINKPIKTKEDFVNFREDVLRFYRFNKNERLKNQRECKRYFDAQPLTKQDVLINRSLKKNIEQLKRERDETDAKLMVAHSQSYLREYNQRMHLVMCHALCQEKLTADIKRYRSEIQDLEKQILRVDKQIYDLKTKAISDRDNLYKTQRIIKRLGMLENQLETNYKREGAYLTINGRLRNLIIDLLHERAQFNKLWRKLITQLCSNKKYLIDLVEYAMTALNTGTDIYQNFDAISRKSRRELSIRKLEMQRLVRQFQTGLINYEFIKVKNQARELADLEDREYRRRQIFRDYHEKKTKLYENVIHKILSFSGVEFVEEAIQRFQKQEDIYYSYFNYSNELNFEITILNDGINALYKEITFLRTNNSDRYNMFTDEITDLKAQLVEEEATTELKNEERTRVNEKMQSLLEKVHNLFKILNCDDAPLMFLLGDHSKVTLFNITRFLKIMEDRINKVMAYVFFTQRLENRRSDLMTVKASKKTYEKSSEIDDIVLAQECAECAEGEEVNPYDVDFVQPFSKDEVKQKLQEKVLLPEMQYRLHSLEECRLPRSRLLANRKY